MLQTRKIQTLFGKGSKDSKKIWSLSLSANAFSALFYRIWIFFSLQATAEQLALSNLIHGKEKDAEDSELKSKIAQVFIFQIWRYLCPRMVCLHKLNIKT